MIEEILGGGHAYSFYRAVEGAKIALSEYDPSAVEFRRSKIDVFAPVDVR